MKCQSLQHSTAAFNAAALSGTARFQKLHRQHNRRQLIVHNSSLSATTVANLDEWITSQGIDATKRSVAVGPTGLSTTKPVAKGETLVSIPDKLWITRETVLKSDIGPLVGEIEPWLAIALFLLYEKAKPSSEWQPYVASLPTGSNSPVAWTEEELKELEGTQLLTSVLGYRTYFQQRYQELQASLFAENADVFSPSVFTYDAFVWAVCAVRSRVHPPLDGDNIALVPLADTISHSRNPTVNWSIKSAGLFGGGQTLSIDAEVALPENTPPTTDFGPTRTEGQLLLDYGAIDITAPVSSPAFALTISLPEDDRFFDDKIDILESNGFAGAVEFALGRDGRPSNDMLAVLRLVNLSGSDAFLLESIFRNEVWEHLQGAVSEPNERALCQSMVDGCQAALAGYPTTIDQDLATLRNLERGTRAHAAVMVRMGEKEALDAALSIFEARIGRLPNLEYYGERRLKRLGLLDKEGKSTWEGFFEDGIA